MDDTIETETTPNVEILSTNPNEIETFQNEDTIGTGDPVETEQTESNYKRAFQTIFELTDEELNKIEDHLRQKIVQNGENFLQKHDNLQRDYEKIKIEFEQRFIELETEFNECQIKLSTESKNAHLYQIKATENEDKLLTLTKQNKILENEKETLISNQQRLSTINQNLEAEKRDLFTLLDKRIKENDRLNEEWKSMNIKLTETESKICEYTAQLEEMKNKESTVIFREKQFQCDKERLLNEIDWLNQQLKEKSMQVLETKGNLNQKIYDLESKIEEFSSESRKNKNLIEALQTANQNMETQIEDLTKKQQEMREREVQLRVDFNEEALSREKLMELYKEENNSCKIKLEEAAITINDLNQMISEAKIEYSKLADEKSLNETVFEAKIKENEEQIAKLDQELKNANELLSIAKRKGATVLSESDIEQLSPAAAVASRLLKSGMTLTQIYSEYVNLSETLQNEKRENERLKSYLAEVINEIEEKAPILKKQRQEYEEAQKTINNLTNQLENAMIENEVLKSKSEDSMKKYNTISSENVRLKQDVNDFSRQITVLLYENEQLRVKLAKNQGKPYKSEFESQADSTLANLFASGDSNDSYSEVSSSTEAINKNVFIFRNIEELQRQNQKLTRLVHEISDKKQSEEKAELEQRTKEFNEKLNLALRELEDFRSQREKQEQILEEIRKQRDTYKQLVGQQQQQDSKLQASFYTSTPGGDQRTKPIITGARSSPDQFGDILVDQDQKKKLEETNAALQKLQKQFEKYQEEMLKTNKLLNEDIEQYRTNNSDLSMKLALSESKLESALEKCKTLNTNTEKLKKELETYKEKGSKLNELIIKHEQSISLTSMELHRTKEKLSELETKLHSTSVERDMFKSNYERLSKEHELLIKENNSRMSILANLEVIRNSCERNERETKLIYTQKIEQLEREMLIQQKQIEQDKEQNHVIIKSWQSQHEQLVQQRERETAEFEKTKLDLAETKKSLEELKQKYNEAEAKLHSNELLVQMTRNSKSSSAISRLNHLEEENKDLTMKLSLAEKEIVGLKIQLEDSRAHAKQYKNISDTMEKTMKEESEAHEKSKQVYESRIDDLNERLKQLQTKFDEISLDKQEQEERFSKERESLQERIDSLEKEKKDLQGELEMLQKKLENMEKILEERTKNRDDYVAKLAVFEEQVKDLDEKLGKSEQELGSTKLELKDIKGLFESKQIELENEKKAKQEQLESFTSSEKILNEEIVKLKLQAQELLEQNNKLQQEFSKVGQDFVILQKQQDLNTSMSTETEQSSSNLLEINRYLRTQKEQLEEKYENLKLSHDINQQRFKTIENDVDFYRKQVQQYENEINQLKQSGRQQEVDETTTNNLILDTNRRLKDDLDSANTEISRLNEEINKLNDEMSNLRANFSASELKCESLTGEAICLRTEVKKWKERVDSLLRSSDMGDEWNRIQNEIQESNEKNQVLTGMINNLRDNLADANQKCEQLTREVESSKAQLATEKQKFEDKENIFKSLNIELRQVVDLIQKEYQLKEIVWSSRGSFSERFKVIKDELSTLKKSLVERINNDKEEIKSKNKAVEDAQAELQPLQKKLEESENKVKEKDIKIGQMTNFVQTTRSRMQAHQKTIDELTKELNELKNNPTAHQHTESTDQPNKADFDQLKSRFLQSQIDNEKLRKELATTNSALAEANSKINVSTTTFSTSSSSSSNLVTSPSSSQTTSSSESSGVQSQPPPTAYIAPSRITPKLQTPQQQTPQQTVLSLRRTAAVQPTPHITQTSVPSEQNQAQWTQGQQTNQSESNTEQQESQMPTDTTPSTSSGATSNLGSSSSFISKRTREDDHPDDGSSSTNTGSNNNKKQRSSNQDQATVENNFIPIQNQEEPSQQVDQYQDVNIASSQETDNNDYIVITDEIQAAEVQELQEENQNEEIILDDDTNGGSQSGYDDVIITNTANRNSNQQISENPNSNSSNNYQQDENSTNNEQIVEESGDAQQLEGVEEEEQIEEVGNEIEEVAENEEENNLDRSGDLHLEIQPDEEESSDRNQMGAVEDSDNQINDERKIESQEEQNSEAINSDQHQLSESAQIAPEDKVNPLQTQQQQQGQKSEQTSSVATTSRILTTTTTAFSSQASARQSLSSNTAPVQLEKPKPIVWDGPPASSSSSNNPFSQLQQSSSASSLRIIRRPPVTQNTNIFQQQQQQQQQSQQTAQLAVNQGVNFFQQDVQISAPQQAQTGFTNFQSNQFRLQNSRFQVQNNQIVTNSTLTNTGTNQIPPTGSEIFFTTQNQAIPTQNRLTPSLIRGPRAQLTPQQQQQQQQILFQQQQQQQAVRQTAPGRIIPTINPRGGGNQTASGGRGGLARGGANANRGGRNF